MKVMIKTRDINWSELWQNQLADTFKNIKKNDEIECSCYWDTIESARNYLKAYGINPDNISGRIKQLDSLPISLESTVLEIGPGPGILTIPLSGKVKHITAIEPANGMFKVLQERIRFDNLNNITLIQNRWEDVDPASLEEGFDLVLASFSLGMPDIKEAILKMSSVSKGEVVLFWHADIPQFEELYSMVWPTVHGREYVSGPKSDILFNILYQMKIYPSVQYFEYYQHQLFSSYQDVQDYFKYQHYLHCDQENENFKAYLGRYITEENGHYIHHERVPCMMFRWSGEKNPRLPTSRNQRSGV
jgi:ubiquinone/menaquinone biosynthesis C-methylase UbiE